MATVQELQQEFYATQLGLEEPWPSLNDLAYLFHLGVKNGDIVIGGGGDFTGTPLKVTWTTVAQARPVTTRPVWWVGSLATPPTNAISGDIVTRTSA